MNEPCYCGDPECSRCYPGNRHLPEKTRDDLIDEILALLVKGFESCASRVDKENMIYEWLNFTDMDDDEIITRAELMGIPTLDDSYEEPDYNPPEEEEYEL